MAEVDTITVLDSDSVEREVPTLLSVEAKLDTMITALQIIDNVGSAAMAASRAVTLATDDTQMTALKAQTVSRYVTVSMTTDTSAQDAGDVLAATQIVAACTPGNDLCGVLHSVTVVDTDDQKAAITLILFDANTTLGTEDAAPDIDDTEALTLQGFVEIATGDYKDLGGASVAHKSNIGTVVKPATGTDDIYIALICTATPTYASGVITLRLGFM